MTTIRRAWMILAVALALSSLSLSACGTSVEYAATNRSPRALRSRPIDSVEVFTAGRPRVSYVEVGYLEAREESDFSTDDMPEMIAALRAEAAEIGCDAIIVKGPRDSVHGFTYQGTGGVDTTEGYAATCIMYRSPPATSGGSLAQR